MILVFDLGTQSFRATLVDRDGRCQLAYSCPIETHRDGSIAEQDPVVWRGALKAALQNIDKPSVTAINATATLSGLVCLDANDEPLRPAILYGDRRPAVQLPAIEASAQYQQSPFRAYSGDFLPQLHYLRDHEPSHFQNAKLLLDATGYLNYLLTGQPTLDRYTTLTCYGDPTGDFLKLGRIVDPGAVIAPALDCAGAPVLSVSYDSAAAYLGSSLLEPGDALDISGTVTSFGVLTNDQIIDPQRRVFPIPYGDRWLLRGSTAMSGGVLEWARQTLFDGTFAEFDQAVLASPPGANGVTFLPFLAGARAPIWDPAATGTFHGLTAQTTRADLARAVYEGLCFSLQHIVETIEQLGASVSNTQLGGGLSRNALLNQMKADVTGRPVRPQLDTEVTTLGAASIAARALGWLPPGGSYCQPGPAIAPKHSAYHQAFDRYKALLQKIL